MLVNTNFYWMFILFIFYNVQHMNIDVSQSFIFYYFFGLGNILKSKPIYIHSVDSHATLHITHNPMHRARAGELAHPCLSQTADLRSCFGSSADSNPSYFSSAPPRQPRRGSWALTRTNWCCWRSWGSTRPLQGTPCCKSTLEKFSIIKDSPLMMKVNNMNTGV